MAVIMGMAVVVGMAVIVRLDGARCRSSTALAIHPTRITVDVMLFFPDRDAVFDLVDDPTTRAERLIAVWGGDAHPAGELAARVPAGAVVRASEPSRSCSAPDRGGPPILTRRT